MAGLIHETNTFSRAPTRFVDFERGLPNPPLSRGADLLHALADVNIPICGALAELRASGAEVVPVLWAEAAPSGTVEDAAFEALSAEILRGIAAASPLDGVFLDLHGAMVTQSFEDADGELLRRVRALVGDRVPIAAALDLHANVTRAMLEHSDFLVACREYPHVDFVETGAAAARGLMTIADTGRRPAKHLSKPDVLLPMPMQATSLPAPAAVYAGLREIEARWSVHASFCMGFPSSDIAEAGPAFVVYGDVDSVRAAADAVGALFTRHEAGFALEALAPERAVARALDLVRAGTRPVVIADVQDNAGGGASSDTTGLLRALLDGGAREAVIGLVWDPESAQRAHDAGIGARVRLQLGGRSGVHGDEPLDCEAEVIALRDGEFTCSGRYLRNINPHLGATARVRIATPRAAVDVVVSSERCQLADLEMLRHAGVEPTATAIIAVKSTAHFRDAFEPIAGAVLLAIAPGEMIADPAEIPYARLRSGVRRRPGATDGR